MPKHLIAIALVAVVMPCSFAESAEDSPRLEIREYRFQSHKGFERLVLEFARKDETSAQPKVKVSGNAEVVVERAILMGAIPESLINDSYTAKSHFLGAVSVSTDNPTSGFSLRVALKKNGGKLKALWLASPPRLVIDATHGSRVAAETEEKVSRAVTVARRHPAPPAFDQFMCFPASAQVGMNVVFQPKNNHEEELKNVRVNLHGVNGEEAPPPSDAIVCYPKKSQVIAQLSFELPVPAEGSEAAQKDASAPPLPANKPSAGNAPAASEDADTTLDPVSGGGARTPATAVIPPPPAAMPATAAPRKAATSPASLLPPLK